MKILLTGATGYIGKRILPSLISAGYQVVCGVRDRKRFNPPSDLQKSLSVIELDLLKAETLDNIPLDIDAAYYLVHSMSSSYDYSRLEKICASNFMEAVSKTKAKQVLYLSGIVNESNLSPHLASRYAVEQELSKGSYNLTTIRAGIIIGSGSASFEIIRDLVEKLPLMITPKWLKTRGQPIGITDVIKILTQSLLNSKTYNKSFDVGCSDILTYKQMLLGYAEVRGLKRHIWIVPVMTPRLSSYWLYFVTSTSYRLASSLVDSMKVEVVCKNDELLRILNIAPISYKESLQKAFNKIKSNAISSSWKDAYSSSGMNAHIAALDKVPQYGCFTDCRERLIQNKAICLEKIWRIGGETGWYHSNWLWRLRGFLDKLVGGVGLRRGRTNQHSISVGDSLDFWRVLYCNKKEGRLLLLAEMKLPGEAWLEFKIEDNRLVQTATFRPLGLGGRLYWYAVLPFHGIIFNGMIKNLAKTS